MNREQAEKLLAAMIFHDLDEPSRTELLAYLQTDDDLRDRLADMRMAVKLTSDTVNDGPAPVLSEHRLKQLKRLAGANSRGWQVLTLRRLSAAAAVLTVGVVSVGLLVPSLSRVQYHSATQSASMVEADRDYDGPAKTATPYAAAREPSGSVASRIDSDGIEDYGGMMGGMGGMASETTNGFRAGGMGGGMMGGMGPGQVSNTAPSERAAEPLYFHMETPADRETLGESIVATGTPPASEGGGVLSSRERGSRRSDFSLRLGQESRPLDESSVSARETYDRLGTVWSQRRPVSEPTTKETEVDARGAGMGTSYGLAGTLTTGKPAVPMSQPTPAESRPTAPMPPGIAPSDVRGPAIADGRVPVLGDMPVVGGFFAGDSKVNKDVGVKDSSEARSRGDELFLAPSDAPEFVQAGGGESLGGAAVREQVVELNTALPPFDARFTAVPVNPWVMTESDPLSTFGLDVDTASYALCRRYIRSGFLPPVGAVRMEEFINAFDYAYPQRDGATFAVYAEGMPSPFAPAGQDLTLLKIAVKARTVGRDQRRAAHIVFVVDASASMGQADRLPQVKAALNLLVDKLSDADRISLVTCADQARLHLEAVSAREKERIRQTIDAIQPAGPTNLLAGLKVGYDMARRAFVAGRINQVVLCSDGVANVGRTEAQDVLDAVEDDRRQGITLTCVGVGYGAYNDAFLEAMADHGDGRYVFLDSSEQARDDLVGQLAATLQTVAKDARIQVQFNSHRVRRYRLIGYENRDIEDRRFRDDTVDAGEVGSGQCSTALYELELMGSSSGEGDGELGTAYVRCRNAETGQIEEISRSLAASMIRPQSIEESPRFFLAAGAARFAEWLRQSEYARNTTPADIQDVLDRVSAALPLDRTVRDLAALVHQAENLPTASETTVQP